MKRTLNLTRMMKSADKPSIDVPEAVDGYCTDESGKFIFEYYSGHPYPENICDLIDNNNSILTDKNEENEIERDLDSSDDEYEEINESDSDWIRLKV